MRGKAKTAIAYLDIVPFVMSLSDHEQQKTNTVGGSPTASHFFLRRQEKVTQKKATPVCRRCAVPSISRKQAGLRNSTWWGAHPAPHCGTRTVLA